MIIQKCDKNHFNWLNFFEISVTFINAKYSDNTCRYCVNTYRWGWITIPTGIMTIPVGISPSIDISIAGEDTLSVETERTIERASEFCKPKFSSEPSEFRACLNLISIPYSWDRAELWESEGVWQPKFLSEPSEFRAIFRLVSTLLNY